MKRWIVIALMLVSTTTVLPQDQTFIDAANTAFKEVRARKEYEKAQDAVIAAQQTALDARAKEVEAKDALIQAMTENARLKDLQIKSLEIQVSDLSKIRCDTTTLFFFIKRKRCR